MVTSYARAGIDAHDRERRKCREGSEWRRQESREEPFVQSRAMRLEKAKNKRLKKTKDARREAGGVGKKHRKDRKATERRRRHSARPGVVSRWPCGQPSWRATHPRTSRPGPIKCEHGRGTGGA
eukprot:996895-Pleurochrysis_carterae.AAC.2